MSSLIDRLKRFEGIDGILHGCTSDIEMLLSEKLNIMKKSRPQPYIVSSFSSNLGCGVLMDKNHPSTGLQRPNALPVL